MNEAVSDRAAGVLLGCAAGDALGAGYEFRSAAEISTVGMVGGGAFDWAPGEWTDDTSMALCVAFAARDHGDLTTAAALDAVAARFIEWFDSSPPDIGNQTRIVLRSRPASAAEMRQYAFSLPGRTGGNGSLMRTAPVALAHLNDADACIEAARLVSDLTHSDPQTAQACQLWSFAIRHAVLYGNFDGVGLFLDAHPEIADFWRPLLAQAAAGQPVDYPQNGWVVHALAVAWSAIQNADDSSPAHLPAALELCVRAGGDTDTTAAIAGSLLGARWGASAVPSEWRNLIHGYPGLNTGDLVELALSIADIST